MISAFGVVHKSFEDDHGRPPRTAYERRTGKVHGIGAANTQRAKGTKLRYGCDHCGREYQLNPDNTLRRHTIRTGLQSKLSDCPGAGKVPKAMRLF